MVFSADPDSAPSPDQIFSCFYQTCWDIIYCNLLNVVLDNYRAFCHAQGFSKYFISSSSYKDLSSFLGIFLAD